MFLNFGEEVLKDEYKRHVKFLENLIFLFKKHEIIFGVRVWFIRKQKFYFCNVLGMVNELHINSYLFSQATSDSITAFYLGKITCNQSLINLKMCTACT